MRPRLLEMENFGAFAGRAVLDFSALDDIFLITGKTGSGKTTIFDGVCFALYGEVPGGRGDHINKLPSDFAEPGSPCRVSLEFYTGDVLWRAERGLVLERQKDGTVKADKSASLCRMDKDGWRSTSANRRETDAKLRELIGLEADEFFKIVLLPQGAFAEFLRLNTTERRKILGKLFPVEIAARTMKAAQDRARETAAMLKEAESSLNESLKQVSFENYECLRGGYESALRQAKGEEARLEAACGRLREYCRVSENEAASRANLVSLREKLAAHGEAVQRFGDEEEVLLLSRKARPLEKYVLGAEERLAARDRARSDAETAAARLRDAEERQAGYEARREEMERVETELAALRERRPFLEELRGQEEALRKNGAERERLSALAAQTLRDCELLRDRLAASEQRRAALELPAKDAPALEQRTEAARAAADALRECKNTAAELETLNKGTAEKKREVTAKETELAALEQRVPVLEAERDGLRNEQKTGDEASAAAKLALLLEDGKPCPVCGAVHHPLPAPAAKQSFGMEERIAAMEAAVTEAREKQAALRTETQLCSREAAVLEQRAATAFAFYAKLWKDAAALSSSSLSSPSKEELETLHKTALDELNAAVRLRDEARRAAARLPELYREKDAAARSLSEKERERDVLAQKRAHLEEDSAALTGKRDALLERWGLRDHNAETALAETEKRIAAYEKDAAEYRAGKEEAGRTLAAARSEAESAGTRRAEAEQALVAAASELEQALQTADFLPWRKPAADNAVDAISGNINSIRKLLLDTEAEKTIEEQSARYRDEYARLSQAAEEQERQLAALEEELCGLRGAEEGALSGEDARERLAALEQEREAAAETREKAAGELAALEKEKERLDRAEARRRELAVEAARYGALADDLCGKNPKKKTFDSWLLGLYLAEVAAFATKRLQRMSEGRYSLHLNTAGENSRAHAGLDLSVFDANTGKLRPCATLSGGESFLASISLALGLADSIQARAGGVRLDAVFVDEGFGSLDDETLNKALDILDELRETRMVGLISHVGEMRSRIPSRVEVVKTASGSKIVCEQG